MTTIPTNISGDAQQLEDYLARLGTEDVLDLVSSGALSIERIADPRLRQMALREHRRLMDDQAMSDALDRLSDDVGIASVIATLDDPEEIIAHLVSETTMQPPEDWPEDQDWAPEWTCSEGWLYVRGVGSEELAEAVVTVRNRAE